MPTPTSQQKRRGEERRGEERRTPFENGEALQVPDFDAAPVVAGDRQPLAQRHRRQRPPVLQVAQRAPPPAHRLPDCAHARSARRTLHCDTGIRMRHSSHVRRRLAHACRCGPSTRWPACRRAARGPPPARIEQTHELASSAHTYWTRNATQRNASTRATYDATQRTVSMWPWKIFRQRPLAMSHLLHAMNNYSNSNSYSTHCMYSSLGASGSTGATPDAGAMRAM